jgi:hypothetical protein
MLTNVIEINGFERPYLAHLLFKKIGIMYALEVKARGGFVEHLSLI